MVSWITRHFASNGKRIAPDLCVYLIDITGGTMTALSGEISKICAYSGADEIKKTDINTLTPIEAMNLIFRWKKELE